MSIDKKHRPAARLRPAPTLHSLNLAGLLAALLSAAILAGCARHYDMNLTNGMRITNVTKPVLDKQNNVYIYKDVAGSKKVVSAGRVLEIRPHSNKDTTPGTIQSPKGSQ